MTGGEPGPVRLSQPAVQLLRAYERAHPGTVLRLWKPAQAEAEGKGNGEGWSCLYPPGSTDGRAPDAARGRPLGGNGARGLRLEAVEGGGPPEELDLLAGALAGLLGVEAEATAAARELTERYEEINLLYSISEILGSVISMRDAASRILAEVADVLSARRASLWLYEPESHRLSRIGGVGDVGDASALIDVDDEASLTARVFRERLPLNLEQGVVVPRGTQLEARREGPDAVLSVPITYSPPEGEARTVGVISLVGSRSNVRFSAGDARMLAAIASQVGAALETQRLMQESLRRDRIVHELELAHNLQLKLLPDTREFEGVADVAARCAPADSVGGDFYHLFRLSGDRLGIVIGDVSSHGFGAALIMALTMSAVAIYAQEAGPPAEVLRRVHRAIIDELESTEMYLTMFYGVLEPEAGRLVYANAGHPHAFRFDGAGRAHRLGATNPPLGIIPMDQYGEAVSEWRSEEDLLCLFTDGLSDTFVQKGGADGERALVEAVGSLLDRPAQEILERLFAWRPDGKLDIPADDRSAVLVRV
ncbi:MAG TPA: GAF domain-containing SpoIIE family protein phosphatase [Longimicrobiales bacterium]|nr:GAF domain-containing SpoIIE family protein phosphatase [Longimicrobiales bacterium]